MMSIKSTLIVNLFGGPSAGKSFFAHGLMSYLKESSIDCEMASEYAKDIFYEESPTKLDNQIYVFGKQLHRIKRILGKVDVIVTDAPLLHSIHYDTSKSATFKELVLEEHNKLNNLNVWLERKHPYNPNGRFQDESGAREISNSIEKILSKNNIDLCYYDSSRENILVVFDLIKEKIKDQSYKTESSRETKIVGHKCLQCGLIVEDTDKHYH